LAFSYLQELAKEFATSYGQEALKPNLRPYAFVQFDTFISATKRVYQDSRAQTNLDRLNIELQDVTRVMTKNIEDLIYRGDSLDRTDPPVTASPSFPFPKFPFFVCLGTDVV
jgi:vesicle transport protein SEC22